MLCRMKIRNVYAYATVFFTFSMNWPRKASRVNYLCDKALLSRLRCLDLCLNILINRYPGIAMLLKLIGTVKYPWNSDVS